MSTKVKPKTKRVKSDKFITNSNFVANELCRIKGLHLNLFLMRKSDVSKGPKTIKGERNKVTLNGSNGDCLTTLEGKLDDLKSRREIGTGVTCLKQPLDLSFVKDIAGVLRSSMYKTQIPQQHSLLFLGCVEDSLDLKELQIGDVRTIWLFNPETEQFENIHSDCIPSWNSYQFKMV